MRTSYIELRKIAKYDAYKKEKKGKEQKKNGFPVSQEQVVLWTVRTPQLDREIEIKEI